MRACRAVAVCAMVSAVCIELEASAALRFMTWSSCSTPTLTCCTPSACSALAVAI